VLTLREGLRISEDTLFAGLLLILVARQRIPLRCLALQLPLACSLGLRPLGIHFFLECPLASFLCLCAVNLQVTVSINWQDEVRLERTCSTKARLCLKVLPLAR
jgi:hypothetical protein